MCLRKNYCLVSFLIFIFLISVMNQVSGQTQETLPEVLSSGTQPPMKNVFYNVLWGSLTGGLLIMSWATVDDSVSTDERYAISYLSTQFLSGATYGGIAGLAVGIYLSIKGVTFDENRSRIAFFPLPEEDPHHHKYFLRDKPRFSEADLQLMNFQYKF